MALVNFFLTAAKLPLQWAEGYQNRETDLRNAKTDEGVTMKECFRFNIPGKKQGLPIFLRSYWCCWRFHQQFSQP